MNILFNGRYKFTHRLEGVVNAFGEDIAQTLAGALETVTGKLMRLTAAAEATPWTQKKKQVLLKRKSEIENVLAEIYQDIGQGIKDRAIETAQATPEIITQMLDDSLPEGVTTGLKWSHLTKNRVLAWWDSAQVEGTFFADYLKKLETSAAERILQASRESLILNEPFKETAKRLQAALDIGRHSAMGLAKTAIHSAVNWAEREVYLENPERLKSLKFQAELDRGTCEYCAFLDSREYALDEAPMPPVHFACETVEKGLRAADFLPL